MGKRWKTHEQIEIWALIRHVCRLLLALHEAELLSTAQLARGFEKLLILQGFRVLSGTP